ncbi:polysaccharide biosynthesis protein [Leptospira levettii]|uniref:oligosaccharide flippase family protein n=1 Tax=Leptospira levettii TaxID=2023178 RepID=UPI000C2B02A3|nr:oligosaccharide flippase family protein [Leptospira levettii]MCW7474540.1 oligosaccharide flippase family protein [Leptospira levettii]PJZ38865.1 polysaccharide biosynthesis protein [Leptospira levettii]PJZ88689.1 polysaccharide biosynthesis protein [Leptospira levettii]PKA02168.1 polysaccharide biosynthesis protein [Leptospira levettii]
MQKIKKIFQLLKVELMKEGVLKNSFFVSSSKAISAVSNLVFMIYSVNLLSKAENGKLQYFLGFLPVVLAIAEFGLPNALIKYISPLAEKKENPGAILNASLRIKFYSFLFLSVITIIAYFTSNENYLVLLLLLFGGIIISFISYFESLFVSYRKYKSLSLWNPLPNIIRLVLLFYFSETNEHPLTYMDILAIFCIAPIFVLFLFFIFFGKEEISFSANPSEVRLNEKKLLLFNLWAFAASIFAILSDRMEIFFLNQFHPPEIVADYGTALQLFSGFIIILATFNSIIYPKMARLAETDEFPTVLKKSVFLGGMIAICLAPGILLAEPILTLLFGTKYTNSISVFKILYPNFLLQLVFAPLGTALFALGLPRLLAGLALLRLLFGALFDYWIIPDFGANGAAVSLFLGQIVSWLLLTGYFMAYFRK